METDQRLSKVLAAAGVASRRACEKLIFDGKVSVNGKIIFLPQTRVNLTSDQIDVDGVPIQRKEEKVYFILNKPKGYICSSKRVGTKKIILDIFAGLPLRLFTVGRLDRDTTGLLLVTNDGHFANQAIHPSNEISKEYLVKVTQEVEHEHLVIISEGMRLEGAWVRPKKVAKVRKGTLRITVMEGKKREVRLLVQKAGLSIQSLKRIRLGGLSLGTLPEGTFRPLTEREKDLLFEEAKNKEAKSTEARDKEVVSKETRGKELRRKKDPQRGFARTSPAKNNTPYRER